MESRNYRTVVDHLQSIEQEKQEKDEMIPERCKKDY